MKTSPFALSLSGAPTANHELPAATFQPKVSTSDCIVAGAKAAPGLYIPFSSLE